MRLWAVAQGSWMKPGTVSSSQVVSPPIRGDPSSTSTLNPARAA